MQHILPKTKAYFLSIKKGLPGKRTFKSSLCVIDFTVSLPKFIRSEPSDIQNEDISFLDHSALHLDPKYL